MKRLPRFARLITSLLWYGFVGTVVLAAVALTVARLVVPEVAEYRRQIEVVASEYIGQPVRIASMDARLAGMRPTLIFKQVSLLDAAGERALARFEEARVQIALFESLREGRVQPAGLTVAGVRLSVTRRADGSLLVQGLDRQAGEANAAAGLTEWLFERSHLAIEDAEVVWTDRKLGGTPLRFSDVALRLRNHRGRHQLDGKLQLPATLGRDLEIALDLEGPGLVPSDWQGRFHAHGRGLELGEWGERLPRRGLPTIAGSADFRLWGHWADGRLRHAAGEFSATGLALRSEAGGVGFDEAAGRLRWRRSAPDGWRLDLDALRLRRGERPWPETRLSVHRGAGQWTVQSGYLRVADARQLLLASGRVPEDRRELLERLAPEGELHGLDLRLGNDPATDGYRVRARFSGLGWSPWGRVPGIHALDGWVWADQDGGRLAIERAAGEFEQPRLFRAPLPIDAAHGSVQWRRESGGWRVAAPQLAVRTPDADAQLGMRLTLPRAEAPFLDLQVSLSEARATAVRRYLPAGIMSPALVGWLDGALRGGTAEGGLVYRGKLQRLPLAGPEARFLAEVRVRGLDLQYHSDWPRLRDAVAVASFTDRAMHLRLEQGRLGRNRLLPAEARIADLRHPYLDVEARTRGELPDALAVLAASPLGHGRLSWVKETQGRGPAELDLRLGIPLNGRVARERPVHYAGRVAFRDSELRLLAGRVDLAGIRGVLEFDPSGVRATGLQTRLLGGRAELELATQAPPGGGSELLVTGRGRLPAAALRERFTAPALRRLSGEAQWWGRLSIGGAGEAADIDLQIRSELAGLGLDLPEPLGKDAAERRPFSLIFTQAAAQQSLRGRLGERASLAVQWEGAERRLARGSLHFGGAEATLPQGREWRVSGSLEGFSAGAWDGLFGPAAAAESDADRPVRSALPVAIDLDRLVLTPGEAAAAKPRSGTDELRGPPAIPPVSGQVREVAYGEVELGEAAFVIAPREQGLALEYLSLSSPLWRLSASGEWREGALGPRTELEATVAGDDTGALLDHLGFASVIRDGRGQVHAAVHWPGGPGDFSAERLAGKVRLHLEKGAIEEVRPGAGRLLGLFSLQALPRRLLLDFSDVFRKGFRFDSMSGSTRLADGEAYTEDLVIEGPSARIEVRGRTGLIERDYEHLVTVVPEVGDTLPLAGGLAWGPQVGAVILVFQKLFKPQIDRAAQFQYRVTGPWESPQVEPVDPHQGADSLPEKAVW